MPTPDSAGYAFNRTRSAYLATHLAVADTHWARFRGLMCTSADRFGDGHALWIMPSQGVHTFGMRFPIDVLYLDKRKVVVHLVRNLKPWRMARVDFGTTSVLEFPHNTLTTTGTAVGDEIEIGFGQRPEARQT